MSDAVEADLARYDRECAEEDRRAEELERLAAAYLDNPAKLGEAAAWIDDDTAAHKRARLLVGMILHAALHPNSVCNATAAAAELGGNPAFAGALEKLAERTIEAGSDDFDEPADPRDYGDNMP